LTGKKTRFLIIRHQIVRRPSKDEKLRTFVNFFDESGGNGPAEAPRSAGDDDEAFFTAQHFWFR
jgi:hypothetical protein